MERLWKRIGVRVLSVALLAGGLIGGISLGQQQRDQAVADDSAALTARVTTDEIVLLRSRQAVHAAARSTQRKAEGQAAAKAATEAKSAASKALKLEKEVIAEEKAEKAAEKAREEAEKNGTVAFTGEIPASCSEFSGNRAIGCALTLEAGFGLDQFACLNQLWNKESGWNHKAENPSSGAYGIPQSYPGDKMASVGADWRTNPATQITWGLGYIKGRYSNPCGAWSTSQNTGSY